MTLPAEIICRHIEPRIKVEERLAELDSLRSKSLARQHATKLQQQQQQAQIKNMPTKKEIMLMTSFFEGQRKLFQEERLKKRESRDFLNQYRAAKDSVLERTKWLWSEQQTTEETKEKRRLKQQQEEKEKEEKLKTPTMITPPPVVDTKSLLPVEESKKIVAPQDKEIAATTTLRRRRIDGDDNDKYNGGQNNTTTTNSDVIINTQNKDEDSIPCLEVEKQKHPQHCHHQEQINVFELTKDVFQKVVNNIMWMWVGLSIGLMALASRAGGKVSLFAFTGELVVLHYVYGKGNMHCILDYIFDARGVGRENNFGFLRF